MNNINNKVKTTISKTCLIHNHITYIYPFNHQDIVLNRFIKKNSATNLKNTPQPDSILFPIVKQIITTTICIGFKPPLNLKKL